MKITVLFAGAVLALAGCTTTEGSAGGVGYQQARVANAVGYMDLPVVDGRAPVVYTGSSSLSANEVARLALLRAAEYTVESGHEWFAVVATETVRVPIAQATDLTSRGALATGSATAGTGAPPSDSGGNVDANLGPSIGGFGGGDVPYQVIERWTPQQGYQTRLVIQMGSGDAAEFPGATSQPQIFPAAGTAQTIRAELQ